MDELETIEAMALTKFLGGYWKVFVASAAEIGLKETDCDRIYEKLDEIEHG